MVPKRSPLHDPGMLQFKSSTREAPSGGSVTDVVII